VNSWWLLAGAILGTGGIAGVVGSLLTGLVNRPKVRADAVKLLTDAAVQQVNEMQEETARMRAEVLEARGHVRLLTAEVDACMAKLRTWRAAILSPAVTREDLHTMVSADLNGRDRI
jgi:ammonia channel protein AmtB